MADLRFTHYHEVLDYIFQQLPMYQRQGPKALKYDLSNITAFMHQLGNPHTDFQSIHIAGTNGKGSTAHYLSSIFTANGYQTGLYTSPHYRDYRERIKIDGEYISKSFVLAFFNKHFDLIETLKPSYFELSVALAFSYFAERSVDIAIIEVGLGGRLDSTNILFPLLSVITNISWDHMQTLGNTLEAIAGEKAGIIKTSVPAMIGDYQENLVPVFSKVAKTKKAPLYFAGELLKNDPLLPFLSGLDHSPFSLKNSQYALGAVRLIQKYYKHFQLSDEKIILGFEEVKKLSRYMGRWQSLGKEPTVIADGAHNTAGWEDILSYLAQQSHTRVHFVIGFVYDKSFLDILPLLPKNAAYYFCQADIPRALPAVALKEKATAFGLNGNAYLTVKKALDAAKREAEKNDLVLVSGSIFVAGEIMDD